MECGSDISTEQLVDIVNIEKDYFVLSGYLSQQFLYIYLITMIKLRLKIPLV